MWQRCFGKTIIMYKYVSVYILLLMYNSSYMCYLGNTFLKNIKLKKDMPFYEIIFCNEMDANLLHVY